MRRKIIVIFFIVLTFIFLEWGESILPTRLELNEVQVTELIGLDLTDNKEVALSVVFEQQKEGQENDDTKASQSEKVLTITAKTFSDDERGLQNYQDKIFIGSHVKSILLGEKLAQNSLLRGVDYISKNNEIRSKSNIYLVRESSASKLFSEGNENNYKMARRMDNITDNTRFETEAREITLWELVDIFLSDEKIGVIPCVELVENGKKQLASYLLDEVSESSDAKRIELAGYGIINGGRLIGYLNEDETDGYDYIKNIIKQDTMSLNVNEAIYGVNLIGSKTDLNFEFLGDALTKVIVKTKTNNFVGETYYGENIFNTNREEIENAENEFIKNKILAVIDRAKIEKVDFIGVGKILQFKHPYKWLKIKEEWKEIFYNVPFEVQVISELNKEYDIVSTINQE